MAYTGSSIVDYLKSIGQASDYSSRAALAKQYGISNYTGSAEQNTQLLNTLRSQSSSQSSSTSSGSTSGSSTSSGSSSQQTQTQTSVTKWNFNGQLYDTYEEALAAQNAYNASQQRYTYNGQTYSTYEAAYAAYERDVAAQQAAQQKQTQLTEQEKAKYAADQEDYKKYVANLPLIESELAKQGITYDNKLITLNAILNAYGLGTNADAASTSALLEKLKAGGSASVLQNVAGVTVGQQQQNQTSTYSGTSIVDYLNSVGEDSSYSARAALAAANGIANYTGTAEQNTALLNKLKSSTATQTQTQNTQTQQTTTTPTSTYTGASVVDYLKSIGRDSSYSSRAALAAQYGISNYSGTAAQNTQLLNLLKTSPKTDTTTQTQTTSTQTTPVQVTTTGKATDNEIQSLYQKYFGRQPSASELTNWKNESSASLDSFLANQYKQATGIAYDGSPVLPGNSKTNNQLSAENKEQPVVEGVPSDITNNPLWYTLTPDQQALIKLAYDAQSAGTAEEKARLQSALEEAIKYADPYVQESIRLVKDELERNVTGVQQDFESKKKTYEDRIKAIQDDLVYNKEQLSLEQQTELAEQLRSNKKNLLELQQSAAESGLAFSSPRIEAESGLLASQQGISQSTRRKYAQAQRSNETAAARELAQIQQGVSDLEKSKTASLTGYQRGAEEKLGSAAVPSVPGVSQLGGITGSIEKQRQQEIANWVETLTKNPLYSQLK